MSDDVVSLLKGLRSDQGDFNENLRSKLLTLAEQPPKKKTDMEVYNELSQNDPELAAIAMIESSGGKNKNHQMDPNSGMTAGGMFGMMPYTAHDVVRLDPNIAAKYPEMVDLTKDYKNTHPKITQFFNDNPEAAAEFAKSLHSRNKSKLNNDPEKTALSWFRGLSGAMRTSPEELNKHDYIQKFRKYYKPSAKITKN